MKKFGLILSILLVVAMVFCVSACEEEKGVTIVVDSTKPLTVEVGSDVDFLGYFIIISDGVLVPTTEDMLDISSVDLTKVGTFEVSCTYSDVTSKITFTVVVGSVDEEVVISVKDNGSATVAVGATVDFKNYFTITKAGVAVDVTDDMLDLTSVDLTKAGTFNVTCSYLGKSATLAVTVEDQQPIVPPEERIVISVKDNGSATVAVGATVDFKNYFTITRAGVAVDVTDDMLDLTSVDLTKAGTFNVTCSYLGKSATLAVTVVDNSSLAGLLAMFEDYDNWNFRVDVITKNNGTLVSEDFYWYKGLDVKNQYTGEDDAVYIDYLQYDATTETYWFVADFQEEGYYKYPDTGYTYYSYVSYMYLADPNLLVGSETELAFEQNGNSFVASNPVDAGETFIGQFEDDVTYTSFTVNFKDGKLSSIVAELSDGYAITYDFYDYGDVSFSIPNATEDTEGDFDWGDWDWDDGSEDDSGDQGSTTVDSLSSTFISADLSVGKGEIQYTSNVGANSLDETRGLQFMQSNGTAILTSKTSVDDVTSVTLIVQTNADKGMVLSVKVGNTSLTIDGQSTYTVYKSDWKELKTVTFTSSTPLSGKVEVALAPTQNKKSMYILTISINGSSSSDSSSGGGDQTSSGTVMNSQTYDESSFSSDKLQDKIKDVEEVIGLPSTGDLNVLVIPVQLSGDTITQAQIDKLKLAFNGTAEETGWESVKSFYAKSSYGKLNLTFDFTDIVEAKNNARYYERYSTNDQSGSDILLKEALSALDSKIDFSKYDSNGDGCIDAVYIIYSASVDYNSDDSFYWAYVTYYPDDSDTYDNVSPYYYMFAGFDFMDEQAQDYNFEINAMTYIHETGHLFGLDDYYDYYDYLGCNEGLGGADMMDYNIGDHGAYSKIMLDWMDATIVNSTQTITISDLATKGDCILVPLNFNNSYFSEYFLIDLYSAKGLNELEANMDSSYLYDGAEYGVRIYHVSSWADKACDQDEYYSVTNYNNSITDIALIKLVQADGGTSFTSSKGIATSADLWQAGDSLSSVFKSYTRNDGKVVNFDISIVSVSADSATITITFAE